MPPLQRDHTEIYLLLEPQALCQLFTSGNFTFMKESRGRSWHGIYTCSLLRCLNFLDFNFHAFDSATHWKQTLRPMPCRANMAERHQVLY